MVEWGTEPGRIGEELIVDGAWSDDLRSILLKKGIEALDVRFRLGPEGEGASIEFLRDLSFLRGLVLTAHSSVCLKPIESLSRLEYLHLGIDRPGVINYSQLPRLRILYTTARAKGALSLFKCAALEELHVSDLCVSDSEAFEQLPNLRWLSMSYGKLTEVDHLPVGLQRLQLIGLPKLKSLDGLNRLDSLQILILTETCQNIDDPWNLIRGLTQLRVLVFYGDYIRSTKEILHFPKLEWLMVSGFHEYCRDDLLNHPSLWRIEPGGYPGQSMVERAKEQNTYFTRGLSLVDWWIYLAERFEKSDLPHMDDYHELYRGAEERLIEWKRAHPDSKFLRPQEL